MHNLCVFCTFSTFAQKIFKGWGCNFTWSFGKVMRFKALKTVFVARIIRHKLCIIYAFFDFFCSKIIFDQKLFSYCWDKFDYLGSIVYLSCSLVTAWESLAEDQAYVGSYLCVNKVQYYLFVHHYHPTLCPWYSTRSRDITIRKS